MATFEWDQNDRYRSNNGAGPLMARILCVVNGVATLERWNTKTKSSNRERFTLTVKFLRSERCGWKKVQP